MLVPSLPLLVWTSADGPPSLDSHVKDMIAFARDRGCAAALATFVEKWQDRWLETIEYEVDQSQLSSLFLVLRQLEETQWAEPLALAHPQERKEYVPVLLNQRFNEEVARKEAELARKRQLALEAEREREKQEKQEAVNAQLRESLQRQGLGVGLGSVAQKELLREQIRAAFIPPLVPREHQTEAIVLCEEMFQSLEADRDGTIADRVLAADACFAGSHR